MRITVERATRRGWLNIQATLGSGEVLLTVYAPSRVALEALAAFLTHEDVA